MTPSQPTHNNTNKTKHKNSKPPKLLLPFLYPFTKSSFFLISMASLLSLSLFSLFLFLSSPTATAATHRHRPKSPPSFSAASPPSQLLQYACKSTRYPDTCMSSLSSSSLPPNPSPLQLIQSSISVSSTNLKTAQSMVTSILNSATGNPNRTTAAKNCLEVLSNSMHRLSTSSDAFLPRGKLKHARAWLSAALLYQYDCRNALQYVNDTSLIAKTMSFVDGLMALTSNALSMAVSYDLQGEEVNSWGPPRTERDGFWEVGSGSGGGRLQFPSGLTVDATVCKDGGSGRGCYKTVQEAVNTAPDNEMGKRFVIRIKEGVYEEIVRVPLEKKNVVFLGDGMGKTVITGSLKAGEPGVSTYNTATVGKC